MLALIAAHFALIALPEPTAEDIVQKGFRDATFTARVTKGIQSELIKIKRDFGETYRFKVVTSYLKEPLLLRLETTAENTTITYVINDFIRYWKISGANLKGSEDLHLKPGKIQTPLDYGLITPSILEHLFVAKYVRTERSTGDLVFDLTYKPKFSDTSRHRVWVDPTRRYVKKREWYSQEGRQYGTFTYDDPEQQAGIWFPSRGSVRNMDGVVAGIVEYEKVKVNTGIPDSVFKT